eukprot:TRINITY_DN955_c0_g1_i1.p1 TRINITY_DN955_c0_g1~~TRINITY_DN955_c0_g1_i1.p1  ORF type:complete len:348 (-),score=127.16 TRINITY_DN955_c0_g1_i1:134-1177(-)
MTERTLKRGSGNNGSKTLLKPASQTLKNAGSVTLNLHGAGSGRGLATLKNINSDGASFNDLLSHVTLARRGYPEMQAAKKAEIPTMWDEPDQRTLEQTRVLDKMGRKVVKMSATFEGVTNMKAEKAQIMDDMHEHSLEKVEDLRQHMEKLLAELNENVKLFSAEWTERLGDQMDSMDEELRARVAALSERYDALEERTRNLHTSIEEETANRIKDTEDLMVPVRKMVADLEKDLQTEKEIREERELELTQHMEENVRLLNADLEKEIRNRIERHREEKMDVESGVARLLKRHAQLGQNNDDLTVKFNEDMAAERLLRVEGQDHIVDRITDFVKRFQAHVLEEGDMGN